MIVATCHKLGALRRANAVGSFSGSGPADNGETHIDVLFVDEAWQVAHHLFDLVSNAAPVWVGVGDVGQLPPIEVGVEPLARRPGLQPVARVAHRLRRRRAHMVGSAARGAGDRRPATSALWRAFYPEWDELDCVAAPGDRGAGLGEMPAGVAAELGAGGDRRADAPRGRRTAAEPEAADIDLPLIEFVESLLDKLFAAGFMLLSR